MPVSHPTLLAVQDAQAAPSRPDSAVSLREQDAIATGALGIPNTIPGLLEDEAHSSLIERHIEPGERVGRYLIEEVLGKGGMGLVLRARDDILQRRVAIKIIQPHYLALDATAGLRFLREAEIVALLNHPHIISVLDAGLDEGTAFLAFEYVTGPSFSQVRSHGRLSPMAAVDLLLPIVSATAHAHKFGVVHGDLKPTNLILGSDYRGAPHPWVLDFGVSFFTDLDAGLDPTHGRISGTPGYMAPEWLDQNGIDGRADCFSLGCVLYELIAGRGPFAGCQRISEAAEWARQHSYKPVSEVAGAPREMDDILSHALAAYPDQRVASAHALGARLLPFASDELRARYAAEFS